MSDFEGFRCTEQPAYFQAYNAYLREDFDAAARTLEEICRIFPERGEFLNDLAICRFLQGDETRSRTVLQKAVDLLGKRSASFLNLQTLFDSTRFFHPERKLLEHCYQFPQGHVDLSASLVSVVILEYNLPELTINCLRSLKESTPCVPFEVILVDNSMVKADVDYRAASGIEELVYEKSAKNLGFAGGCNRGASLAKGQWLYFLNNDTLLRKDSIDELVKVLVLDADVGIVGSKLLYEDGTLQHAGMMVDVISRLPRTRGYLWPPEDPSTDLALDVQMVTGASIMVRKELFERLGGLDETYKNGFEDIDFCLKALKKGYKVIYNPRSILVHLESKSKGRFDCETENQRRYMERWSSIVRPDELEYKSLKEYFMLCFTEEPRRMDRQARLFQLFRYLDRKHPDCLDQIPLCFFEKAKHFRFQKACHALFHLFADQEKWEEAGIFYRYFLRRSGWRITYLKDMRDRLKTHGPFSFPG